MAVGTTGTLVLSYVCPADFSFTARQHCPLGLGRSTDAGRTWHPVGPALNPAFARGLVRLADGSFLAALAPHIHGVPVLRTYRSRDDGRTWQMLGPLPAGDPAGDAGNMSLLFALPWDAQQVLAGYGFILFYPVLYRSTDGGTSFASYWLPKHRQDFVDEAPVSIAALRRTRTLVMSDYGFLYRSTDGGRTWHRTSTGQPAKTLYWALLAAPDGTTIYVGCTNGVLRSTDDGRTWKATSTA
jgi:photosystem II stability/assembly factor-like uncharacterized protein